MDKKRISVFASVFILILATISCKSATGPDGVDNTPRLKTVPIKYVQVLPLQYPDARSDWISLSWGWGYYVGEAFLETMTATGEENSFIVQACSVKTETAITIRVNDLAKYDGSSGVVCKAIYVDGKELVTNKVYGEIRFIYKNDGTIKVYE
jgi:hypothetical protein